MGVVEGGEFALVDSGEVHKEHVKSTAPPVPLPGCADGCDIGFWLGYEGYDVSRVYS